MAAGSYGGAGSYGAAGARGVAGPHATPDLAQASLEAELCAELAELATAGRLRAVPEVAATGSAEGRRFDFTSNDYLGLASDERVIAAARAALADAGAGGRAARLLGGGAGHAALEALAAAWLGVEATLFFASGYQANLGLITSLTGKDDVLFSDALNHASLIDGMRLSPARRVVFPHRDLLALEVALERSSGARRRLIVTETVFSMDGDRADLAALHELAETYDAWLLLDEAHAVGLLGPAGAGLGAELAARPGSRVLARTITGGKALGNGGALVAGSAALVQVVANRARSFVFSTASTPALAAGLAAAIERVQSDPEPARRALAGAARLAEARQLPTPGAAIVPIPIGDERAALAASLRLGELGFDVRAVRPPTVPPGTSRLRIVCHAWQGPAEIDALVTALREVLPEALEESASTAGGDANSATRSANDSAPEVLGDAVRRGAPSTSPPVPATNFQRKPKSRVLFVAGTDTDVGKTVVSALLLRALDGEAGRALYWKPVQTGDDSDSDTVRHLAGRAAHELQRPAWQLPKPASPHEAAAAANVTLDPARIFEGLGGLRRLLFPAPLVVELAGGLLVPYTAPTTPSAPPTTQLDWLDEERPPFVLVARSGLGTLNHTMLSLAALAARHLVPKALFLVGPPHAANAQTLADWTGLCIHQVPHFTPLVPAALEDWLAAEDFGWL